MLHLFSSTSDWVLLGLAAFAGALHILAPDHWMPLSLASWQRRWGVLKTVAISLVAMMIHLAAGFLIYLAIRPLILSWNFQWIFPASVALVLLSGAARTFRFSKIRDVLLPGPKGQKRIFKGLTVLALLGPCESLIPVMIKGHQLGMGYLDAFLSFAVGTILTGALLIVLGRFYWNQPLKLKRGVNWALRPSSALPVALGLVVGLVFLLRLRT